MAKEGIRPLRDQRGILYMEPGALRESSFIPNSFLLVFASGKDVETAEFGCKKGGVIFWCGTVSERRKCLMRGEHLGCIKLQDQMRSMPGC